MCRTSGSSTGPDRTRGGAANSSRPEARRTGIRPAAHSCTIVPAWRGVPPASSQAWQVPRVGWPANGSSADGVKMRTR